jgi:CHAT domain-containing protein/Flp pilus assembly protein TadD
MKKIHLVIFVFLLPLTAIAQEKDSTILYQQIDSLVLIGQDYISKREYQKAERTIEIALQKLDSTDHKYVDCLDLQFQVLYFTGRYKETIPLLEKIAQIREESVGTDHPIYAKMLTMKGLIYRELGQFKTSEKYYLEALLIQKKAKGKDRVEYARTLNNLSMLYISMNVYDKAELLILEAHSIREEILSHEDPQYANSLENLGEVYGSLGKFKKAESLLLEAKSIREKILGKEHPDYAKSLHSLSNFYMDTSQFKEAESSLLEATELRKKELGTEHPSYAMSLNSLATLYHAIRQYDKAESLLLACKAIVEKVFGKEHPAYSVMLNNLAAIYARTERREKAELFLLEANEVDIKLYGKNDPIYAVNILNLAVLYEESNKMEKSESFFLEALSILEQQEGSNQSTYSNVLSGFAGLLYKKKDFEKAQDFYKQSLSILETMFDKNHPSYAENLRGLAVLNMKLKQYGLAENYLNQVNLIDKNKLIAITDHLSDIELQKYLIKYEKDLALFASFVQLNPTDDLISSSYNNMLFYKGFLLNNALRVENATNNASLEIQDKHEIWKQYKVKLAKEYGKSLENRNDISNIEKMAYKLEKELLSSLPTMAVTRQQVSMEEVKSQLQEGEAAIEFFNYQFRNPDRGDSIVYAAIILRPGNYPPKFVLLFEKESILKLVKNEGNQRAEYVNNLYLNNEAALYNLIWKPIEKELEGVKTVYYSPSGLLHLLNIGTISNAEEMTISDKYQLHRLNSTRELVTAPEESSDKLTASLFGGIRYESQGTVMTNPKEQSNVIASTRGQLAFSQIDSTLRNNRQWEYLESTVEEIDEITSILKTAKISATSQKANTATEESFKALSKTKSKASPSIIHIATHGYFFPNPTSKNANSAGNNEPIFKTTDHPMIRSGLLFAGSNYAWQNGKSIRPNMEDGILTAYEISQIDLSDTELVVLSACETGLGDLQGNEGVYGLQRAFKIAGVKNILMSLWQVPDYQTKELMIQFYKNWLEEKMDIHEALKVAQNAMREEGYEPFHWAGFVLLE